jgi:hypothetical protein
MACSLTISDQTGGKVPVKYSDLPKKSAKFTQLAPTWQAIVLLPEDITVKKY